MRSSTPQFTPVANPHALVEQLNPARWAMYRAGAELHVYRNVSPNRWWLQSPGASDSTAERHGLRGAELRAYLLFSQQVFASHDRALQGSRSGAAVPAREVWAYAPLAWQAAVERWDYAVTCAQTFNQLSGTADVDIPSLTAYQRRMLRGLRKSKALPMFPHRASGEGSVVANPDVVDLCARGLAYVDPIGVLRGTELLERTTLPTVPKHPAAQD